MANAGYGNHTAANEGDPPAPAAPTPEKPRAEPQAVRPKASDEAGTASGHSDKPSPGENVAERHVSTPGAGSLPSDGAGDDADPGAG